MTIAVLSWGAHKTLISTLESYKKFNLDDDDKIIFFQAMTDKDVEIAHTYGYKAIGEKENIGIGPALQRLVAEAQGKYFLFLENDWECLREARYQITAGRFMLDNNFADVVRYRDRETPGWPLWSMQFKDRELERPEFILESLHWRENPDQDFPDKINTLRASIEFPDLPMRHLRFYTTDSRYANFTNNPSMYLTEFLRRSVVSRASGEGIRLEVDIQDWWQNQRFKVAQGEGLFTHMRLD